MRRSACRLVLGLALASSGCALAPGGAGLGGDVDLSATGVADDSGGGQTDDAGVDLSVGAVGPDLSLTGPLTIAPQNQIVALTVGQPVTTVQFTATINGNPVSPSWAIDRAEIGSIGVATALFTPTGALAGKGTVTAMYGGQSVSTNITVKLTNVQVGDPGFPAPTPGAGGYGGVGGNGPGKPATAMQQTTLNGVPTMDPSVSLLYPYDGTVWPRGMLAPLLQWNPGGRAFDSVYLDIQESNYEYKGYFGNPGAKPFVNLPIPQAAWKSLTYSNAGENVKVILIFGQGANAYGPYVMNWRVAQATLEGTVYYNSYGTNLVRNSNFTVNGAQVGGATLAIKPGATDPTLVAGTNGPADGSGCRVCHVVSAKGGLLVTQHGNDYSIGSSYDLVNGNAESVLPAVNLAFPALSPDGKLLFSGSGQMLNGDTVSRLYALPAGTLVPNVVGIPSGLQGTVPAFSPDGKHVAFNWSGGSGSDQVSLASLDFDGALTFSSFQKLFTPAVGPAVWPSYLPSSSGLVFEVETASNEFGFTRSGVRGELWWYDLASKKSARLDQLDGLGYLPRAMNNHGLDGSGAPTTDYDVTLNYEPTINPVASGGYAWVVFTSRRLYGNVATIDPFASDPRTTDLVNNVTTKKLWVAAIDLNAAPGTDPSHPAFYLPAQEVLAGNSRGFWTVDPCHADGTSCLTGDQCCGGYCQPGDGGFQCSSQQPSCATEFEKCVKDSECCGVGQGITCIGGRCTRNGPAGDLGACVPAGGNCTGNANGCCGTYVCTAGNVCGIL